MQISSIECSDFRRCVQNYSLEFGTSFRIESFTVYFSFGHSIEDFNQGYKSHGAAAAAAASSSSSSSPPATATLHRKHLAQNTRSCLPCPLPSICSLHPRQPHLPLPAPTICYAAMSLLPLLTPTSSVLAHLFAMHVSLKQTECARGVLALVRRLHARRRTSLHAAHVSAEQPLLSELECQLLSALGQEVKTALDDACR